ncbi:MAG: ZIP family metal transporter [Gammaproteobacteria bacterium]|nr:ZIP family metal transporter [Gammaproteobacteria bacterium]
MTLSTWFVIGVLALLSGMTTLIGVTLAIYSTRSPKTIAFGIGFSTGIMLLVSCFELIPAAIQTSNTGEALISLGAGVLFLGLLHWLIPHTHLFKEKGKLNLSLLRSAYLVAFGLILHDIPEGFAMANSFLTSPSLGMFVAISIALHNIPEEYVIAIPATTLRNKGFLYKMAFISGMAEPAGALLGLYAAYLSTELVPYFLSFTAGAMIYISLHELMPLAKRYGYLPIFALGFTASVLVHTLLSICLPE